MLIMIKQKQSGFYIYERDFKDVHAKESLYNIFWLEQIKTLLSVLALLCL